MTTEAKPENITEQAGKAASNDDAAFSDILPVWEQVFCAYKSQWLKASELVSSEISLSFKALALCWISLLVTIALSFVIWLTLNLTIAYGIYATGTHWLAIPITIFLLNGIGIGLSMLVYKASKASIGLPKSKNILL